MVNWLSLPLDPLKLREKELDVVPFRSDVDLPIATPS
jgi:hypothetical protein